MGTDHCQNKFQHISKEEQKPIKLPTSCSIVKGTVWLNFSSSTDDVNYKQSKKWEVWIPASWGFWP